MLSAAPLATARPPEAGRADDSADLGRFGINININNLEVVARHLAGNNAVFTISMTGSISSSYTIWYSTYAGTASAADGDYPGTYVNQPLTFNPGGPTTQQIVIPTLTSSDSSTESAESFSVGLQSTQTGNAFTSASATILPNTVAPSFSISGPGTVTAGNNAVFTISMTRST